MRIFMTFVALLVLIVSRADAQKLELYMDEQGKACFRVQFKMTPKAIDENRIIIPLTWDFADRNSGNAAHSYNRATIAYYRITNRNARENYQQLLTKIWDKTDNNQTVNRAFLIEKMVKPTVPLPSWTRKQVPEDEWTPEDVAVMQRDIFLDGINQKTWEHEHLLPLEKPEQVKATREFIRQCDEVYRFIEEGSRCDNCDFGIPFRETDNPLGLRIEEIHSMRALGRLVQLRVMLELHEGRYQDALKSIRIGMALARQTGKQPLLVSGLAGTAICGTMQEQLVDLINRPDSPNLYWEVASLPNPFLSFGEAMDMEKNTYVPQSFPLLKKALDDPDSLLDEEWRIMIDQMTTVLQKISPDELQKQYYMKLSTESITTASYPPARRWLLDQGKTAEEIDAMIPEKVVGLHVVYELQLHWNNYFRATRLPLWEEGDADRQAQQIFHELDNTPFKGSFFARRIIWLFLPASQVARSAYRRIQSGQDMLRIAEAIRDYAATNGGTVPATLKEITAVSVPMIDPSTGVPYHYHVADGVGQIELPHINPKCTVFFEIVK